MPFAAFNRQLAVILVLIWRPAAGGADEPPRILVPAGFRVDHFADDHLAHDIHSMAIDANGRVVVSGPGYIRILLDTDNDGRADDYIQYADGPKSGAQGMCFLGPNLLCTGDEGLLIFHDKDGDSKADGPATTVLKMNAGGDHQAHSIQRGPDGWWYIIVGNMTEISAAYATLPTSPIKNPHGGVLMRLSPDLSGGEILCDGLRNAYDFAFNVSGDIFTVDSDGEQDVSLPWYQPCRLFHLTPRAHAGWTSDNWRRPDDLPDMPPVLADFGRGSPTGVTCYQHTNFPSRYDGALFVLDWKFGRIMAVSMEENHGLWKANTATFAKGSGSFEFAPTDIEVGADGHLLISVGGRGTSGSVYRIVYAASTSQGRTTEPGLKSDPERLNDVLNASQPLSSWSRAKWEPVARELGESAFIAAAMDEGRRAVQRMRAIEILTDTFGGLQTETINRLKVAESIPVRARTAWAIGRTRPESPDAAAISTLLNDGEPLVVRFALEALAGTQDADLFGKCLPRLAVTLNSTDRSVRAATSKLMLALSPEQQEALSLLTTPSIRSQIWMALGRAERSDQRNIDTAETAMQMLTDKSAGNVKKFEALRVLQLSLGDVGPAKNVPAMFESYAARADFAAYDSQFNPVRTLLAAELASGDAKYDRELIRTIAMLGASDADLINVLLQGITADSPPAADIHRLAALTRNKAPRTSEQSRQSASALVGLDAKMIRMNLQQGANWDDRILELYEALIDADADVPSAIVGDDGFGQPGHIPLLRHVAAADLVPAIHRFARTAQSDADYQWTNDVVFLLSRVATKDHLQLIREQFENLAVQDAVLIVLARDPQREDRRLFLQGLSSTQISAVQASVSALIELPRQNDAAEQYRLLRAANRLNNNTREFQIREACVRLLQNNLSQSFGFIFGNTGHGPQPEPLQRWAEHLQTRFPNHDSSATGDQSAE